VVVGMEMEVEAVVEATGRRRRGSSLGRWCVGDEACVYGGERDADVCGGDH
jgi:hypothetical protein